MPGFDNNQEALQRTVAELLGQGNPQQSEASPPVAGDSRLERPQAFQVARATTLNWGGLELTFTWRDASDPRIAGYRIYFAPRFGTNITPTLIGGSDKSPARAIVSVSVETAATFWLQPYLKSGLDMPLVQCPTATWTIPEPVYTLNRNGVETTIANVDSGGFFFSLYGDDGTQSIGISPQTIRMWQPSATGTNNRIEIVNNTNSSIGLFADDPATEAITFTVSSGANICEINLQGTTPQYKINGTKVLGPRQTGWTAPTGTATRTGFATGSATITQLAEALKAVIDDLTASGAIGA